MRNATIASSNLRLMVRPPNGRLLRASCWVMLLAPSLAEPLMMSRTERARHAAPIDAAVLVEAGVFAREQRLNEERRNFLERNFQPIGAGQTAVDFAVDVENGVALRHGADPFQVEGLGPDRVEGEHGDDERDRQGNEEEGQHPAPAAAALFVRRAGRFPARGAREEFHR